MRSEFAVRLRALLAPQWVPADLPGAAPYLKLGAGRESRYFSHFYASYKINDASFMVKAYFA